TNVWSLSHSGILSLGVQRRRETRGSRAKRSPRTVDFGVTGRDRHLELGERGVQMKNSIRVITQSAAVVLLAAAAIGVAATSPAPASPRLTPPGRLVVDQFSPDKVVSMLPDGTDPQTVLRYPHSGALSTNGIAVTRDGGTIAAAFGFKTHSHSFKN